MKDIVIVGAGGFGRELLQWIKDINTVSPTWRIKGFIDDDPHALDGLECDYGIINTIDGYKIKESDVYALAIANPVAKEKVVDEMTSQGAVFTSIIHPRAVICDYSFIGNGVVIYPNCIVGPNTKIGNYVTLLGSGVGHDVSIDSFSTISSYCDITGGATIGKRVFLASRVTLVPNTVIGDDAYIGAGSVVIRNVKARDRMFGYPAKRMEF